ncbi:MAG: hypothetical protein JXA75_04700, partial [Candidatus Thermoplasmatota archaeon]|nr:hypothetical protein [Candidatus Thermoplasmatota archaeon]
MINGIGFFELLVVVVIILIFFGSKELPQFIREGARFISKLRKYSDMVKQELNDVARVADIGPNGGDKFENEVAHRKNGLRSQCLARRDALTLEQREEKSHAITAAFLETTELQ